MNSKNLVCLLAGLLLCGNSSAEMSTEAFVESSLGRLPAEKRILLQGDVQEAVRSAYDGRYPAFSIPYREQDGKRVWVLKAQGKHGYVKAGFVIQDGRLLNPWVLSSKEQGGRGIETSPFLKQFEGVGLKGPSQMDRRIDGLSGATLSVNAMKKMARTALVLDSFVTDRVDGTAP